MINMLHKVACKILKKSSVPYTSHTWHWSAATNLANAGVSFINLKRHGQWLSDSVVKGCIANSKPLQDKMLHCLMPNSGRNKCGKRTSGSKGTLEKPTTTTGLLKIMKKLICQTNHLNQKVPIRPLLG